MEIVEVEKDKDLLLKANVFPNVIKNRYDLLYGIEPEGDGYTLFCLSEKDKKYIFRYI